MPTKTLLHTSSWSPDRPTSKGATAYHDAVVYASWHIDNIQELIDIFSKNIRNQDVVVDFGAGTGASAVYFLKKTTTPYNLWLVDNSPSWLGKAYDVLRKNKHVNFFLLEKTKNGYETLDKTIGEKVNHVVCANTVHLIPDIDTAFKGIYKALKSGGTFTFQSGNISRKDREKGIMTIDDSVKKVHDIAVNLIKTNDAFKQYRKDLAKRIRLNSDQRKLVFPDPRPTEYYVKHLQSAGFKKPIISYKRIKVSYEDWLRFLRVRRLQAGILPEVGGKDAAIDVEHERDQLITLAARKLFSGLSRQNPFADNTSFTAEWTYVSAKK